jgi:D-glycero-alpha-D-manno-heptose-7-phosphate kinase
MGDMQLPIIAGSLLADPMRISKVRARAPLRLGFGGGGTDVPPFCDDYGGIVLNATIAMHAHASIEMRADGKVQFIAVDNEACFEGSPDFEVDRESGLALHQGVYKRIVKEFLGGAPLPVTVTTYCDAPPGSGLGSSSTLVVAMLQAYRELLALPLGEYDIAQLAYDIERVDIGQLGGRQDQYSATFGGVNFMEFRKDQVIVNPLRIRPATLYELEAMTVLYFTGVSRSSASIIGRQVEGMRDNSPGTLAALHQIKRDAVRMKEALLRNDLRTFAEILGSAWETKKNLADGITNGSIDRIFDIARDAGALAGKVTGAGGGGYIFFIVEPTVRPRVLRALGKEAGHVMTATFTTEGAQAWRI